MLDQLRMWTAILVLNMLFFRSSAFLYPEESESRQVKTLNGIWLFMSSYGDIGFQEKWYEKDFNYESGKLFMPVPSSFNDVWATVNLRDFLGWVWYQKEFYLGKKWAGSRVFVHFGAVDHHAVIWCNGNQVGRHSGGHIPFQLELTREINWDGRNTLTLAVNNTLTPYTLPQGYTHYYNNSYLYPPGTPVYSHNCDYFDYAGINRNVYLYSVPQVFINDLDIQSECNLDSECTFKYKIKTENKEANLDANCSVVVTDEMGKIVVQSEGCDEVRTIDVHHLWQPYTGHLYKVEFRMQYKKYLDVYRTLYGFRKIEWGSEGLVLNGKKMYLRGFGMHEDSDIRGRGYDDVLAMRDISLLIWSGANVIRTSHYPYSQEFLKLCDEMGIAVILEIPACSLTGFSNELYVEHEKIMLEIIDVYKNHPSIIMWSLANEPETNDNASTLYFEHLYEAARAADPTRPITFVTSQSVDQEKAVGAMDFILVNRYSGWYQGGGRLDLIEYQTRQEVTAWRKKFNKPVVFSEYGAGSIPGQHSLESAATMWTEEYQVALLKKHFEIFDKLKEEGLLFGEMIWNFIDFKTPQEYNRPGFCMKGIYTRQREPKQAVNIVQLRYMTLRYSDL